MLLEGTQTNKTEKEKKRNIMINISLRVRAKIKYDAYNTVNLWRIAYPHKKKNKGIAVNLILIKFLPLYHCEMLLIVKLKCFHVKHKTATQSKFPVHYFYFFRHCRARPTFPLMASLHFQLNNNEFDEGEQHEKCIH